MLTGGLAKATDQEQQLALVMNYMMQNAARCGDMVHNPCVWRPHTVNALHNTPSCFCLFCAITTSLPFL